MGNYGFTVIGGDMKYIDPSGAVIDVAEAGSGSMIVNFTLDDSGDAPVITADKTFEEISAAVENGQYIYGIFGGSSFLNCTGCSDANGALFTAMDVLDTTVNIVAITIASTDDTDDTVTFSNNTYDLSSLIVN